MANASTHNAGKGADTFVPRDIELWAYDMLSPRMRRFIRNTPVPISAHEVWHAIYKLRMTEDHVMGLLLKNIPVLVKTVLGKTYSPTEFKGTHPQTEKDYVVITETERSVHSTTKHGPPRLRGRRARQLLQVGY